jgi:hypothetical protein
MIVEEETEENRGKKRERTLWLDFRDSDNEPGQMVVLRRVRHRLNILYSYDYYLNT